MHRVADDAPFFCQGSQKRLLIIHPHRPRVLWANAFCLMDTSSGAAITVRQMLRQLHLRGFDVRIFGATNFDHPRGATGLGEYWQQVKAHRGRFVRVPDEPLTHELFVTANTDLRSMTCAEESAWFAGYCRQLEAFRPDLVFTFGGQSMDFLLTAETRYHGIPVVFYMANSSYKGTRWCRDVDLVVTNTRANADMYQKRIDIDMTPLGMFIDPAAVTAPGHEPRHVLFINPSPHKGGVVAAYLAMVLEKKRPDIMFEVVETRGGWQPVLKKVLMAHGDTRDRLDNVIITPNTLDMRPIYGRARVLLAPSLWWESAGRVVVEALFNRIPVIVTNHGGMPEIAGKGAIILSLPDVCHRPPYLHLPSHDILAPVIDHIMALYDDADYYDTWREKARQAGAAHAMDLSTDRLVQSLEQVM